MSAPLALVFARHGFRTRICDINAGVLEKRASGQLPVLEDGGPELLSEILPTGRLGFSSDISSLAGIPNLMLTIGTPIDEFRIDSLIAHLSEGQLIVLRSTVFPGVTEHAHRYLAERLPHPILLALCPE